MVESTLSLTRNNLRSEVGLKLGYGLNVSSWTPEQIERIDLCVRDGMANFYFPIVQDQKAIYEWSFLRKTAEITLTATQTEDDLPDDCDGIIEGFTVTTGDAAATIIPVIPVLALLKLRATSPTTEIPKYAAIRPKDTDPTTSVSQRYEVMWCPTPNDSSDKVQYEYPVQVDSIGSTDTYLPGGASHGQTIVTSCLAVAEQLLTPDEQIHQQAFQQRLQASIEYDKRNQQTRSGRTWDLTEPTYGTWDWFRREVSGYLLGQWDTNLLTHSENAQVESLVQRGLKTFYNPPGQRKCWSFLYVTAEIELTTAVANYELPADFIQLHSPMTFQLAGATKQPIRQVTDTEIRASAISEATSGSPEYVCIREKTLGALAVHTGATVYLHEAFFFPTPSAASEYVTYRYKANPALLSSSLTYPYGSDVHAETMRQAMIAHAAEQKEGGNQQEEWQKFQQALASSMFADVDVDVSDYDMSKALNPPQSQPPPQRQER